MTRAWLFALLVASAAPAQASAPAHSSSLERRIALTPCRLKGAAAPAVCGTLEVPEDRAHPDGRRVRLRVALVPALARTPAPDPLFLLAGGPGQAATEVFGRLLPALERIHRTRDLVLVDQRGTGKSNPLDCPPPENESLRDKLADDAAASVQRFRACVKRWDADTRFYTTPISMQDLDEVREGLGYDQINLWGGSYGTRAALVYLREHGAHVRTVTLDGVAPLSLYLPLDLARDAQRAMDLLFQSCAKELACAKAFPDLESRFNRLLKTLEKAPAQARVADPVSGVFEEVVISHDAFTGGLRGVLYLPDLAALVPLTVEQAARGNYGPFVAETVGLAGGFERSMSQGLLFAIVCNEDMPFIQPGEIEAHARDTFLGPALSREFLRVCEAYPKGAVLPPGYREPVASDKPVLLLSGELDPVTPPSWAAAAAKTLPHSLQVVVSGVGHGVSAEGCVPSLLAQFINQGSADGLETSCLQTMGRPPFFVSASGPAP